VYQKVPEVNNSKPVTCQKLWQGASPKVPPPKVPCPTKKKRRLEIFSLLRSII